MSHDMHTTPTSQSVTSEMPSSFRCGFNHEIDAAAAAAGLTGALSVGGLTVLRGPAKSGRTTQLVQAVEAVMAQSKDDEVVILAVPAGPGAPARISTKLLETQALSDRNTGRLDVAFIEGLDRLVAHIDSVLASGRKIAAVFIDDFGLIADTALDKSWKVPATLAQGWRPDRTADGTPAFTQVCDPYPVMVTIRRQPMQTLPIFGLQWATLVVSTDGELTKSRYFQLRAQGGFYVEADETGMRTLWRCGVDKLDDRILVEADLPEAGRPYWDRLVASFTG